MTPDLVGLMTKQSPPLCRKSERKITFAQFQKALELAAQTKYPGDRNGYKKLVDKVVSGKGPVAAGTTVSVEGLAWAR